MKRITATLCTLFFSVIAFSQNWERTTTASITGVTDRVVKPQQFNLTRLDVPSLLTVLNSSPQEFSDRARTNPVIMQLPMPDGSLKRFRITQSSIMEKGLADQFPEIKTYAGQGIDDPYTTVRMDYNPYFGFSAQILSSSGTIYVDPYSRGNTQFYQSYSAKDYRNTAKEMAPFVCHSDFAAPTINDAAGPCRGTQLFTYRLAVACTGEYAVAATGLSSPTVAQTLAKIVTTVNRVTGIYENEVAVRLLLISNESAIIFTNASTDPFNGNNDANTLIDESQSVITTNIGSANFDVGHTFSTGGGGLAGLGVVCVSGQKASGITGSANPVGDAYDVDYVAHELGHQFGGNHTFNSVTGSCGGGNRNAGTAYEVGSGTTIMAYAGICGTDNIQPNSDPFFHSLSYDEISNYITTGSGNGCKGTIATGNTLPQITAMNNNGANIPLNTPFTLSATATDANGDALTYCWEEWDLGTSGAWNNGASSTTAPLFKSRVPVTSGSRTFPDMAVILAGYPASPAATMGGLKGETLPGVARAIKFRLTVRDNRSGGGGVVTGGSGCQTGFTTGFQVNTITGTGPFAVTSPNTAVSWAGGSSQTITWNVAGSSGSPISCANVKISLSTDGGLTYPTILTASTANDGTEALTIPNTPSTQARVKIEAVGNIFFDISNVNFTITAGSGCTAPSGLSSSAVTTTSATVSWTAVSGAVSYDVDYKTNASGTWTNAATGTTSTSVNLSGLSSGTLYDWRVRTNCSGSSSSYSSAQFTTTTSGGCSTAYEPNETQAAAAAIATNTAISAAISPSGDVDYYSVNVTATSNFNITLTNLPGDYDLYFYNSAGTQIGSSEAGGTTSETITLSNQTAGTYYVRVIGYNGANSAAVCYNLTVNATTVTGCASSYDVSTNGTTSGAATIPFNTNITGLISPTADVDNYKFVITTGGTITVTLGTLPADYDLKLLNSAGTQVGISQNGSTTSETINYTAAAGTYYAQVYGYNGANNATTCYTLKVQLGTASRPEMVTADKLSVSPNPASGFINITIPGDINGRGSFRIMDAKGNVVLQQGVTGKLQRVDVSKLPAGVYLVQVNNNGYNSSTRFVKQ
jgi:hypothetical protein